jgi:hypothetical protein
MKAINRNIKELRVIKTARRVEDINIAAKLGFRPLIKQIKPSKKIRSKYAVIQNKKTGEIQTIGDYRIGRTGGDESDYEIVIDWTYHYPYKFDLPYAAYLIPKDIKPGERVFIEDLIEDFVGMRWNQGNTYRLESCEAIWNGSDLEIQYSARRCTTKIFG